jgi:hypothetical protein
MIYFKVPPSLELCFFIQYPSKPLKGLHRYVQYLKFTFTSCSYALNTLLWVTLDYLSIQMKEMKSRSIHLINFISIFMLPNFAAFGT